MKPNYEDVKVIADKILDNEADGFESVGALARAASPKTEVDFTDATDLTLRLKVNETTKKTRIHRYKGRVYVEARIWINDREVKGNNQMYYPDQKEAFRISLFNHLSNIMV